MLPFSQCPEDTVDEAGGAVGAIAFGKFHSFVDGDFQWGHGGDVEFPQCKPEDVSVDDCQLVHRPFRCIFRDELIEFRDMLQRPGHERAEKPGGFLVQVLLTFQMMGNHTLHWMVNTVDFVKCLKRKVSCASSVSLHTSPDKMFGLLFLVFIGDILNMNIDASGTHADHFFNRAGYCSLHFPPDITNVHTVFEDEIQVN